MTLYRSLFFWLRINFIYCTVIVYNKKKSKGGDDGREQAKQNKSKGGDDGREQAKQNKSKGGDDGREQVKQKKSKVSDDGSGGKAPVKYNTILLLIDILPLP